MNFNENRINENEFEYVGFWARVGASLIDVIILMLITVPIMLIIYGDSYLDSESLLQGPVDFFVSYVFPAIAVIIFWYTKQATPGKMAIGARLVDARTGNAPSIGQLIGRYFAYIISTLPLCLGYFWIAFD